MEISKTTFNMALNRGLQLTVEDGNDCMLVCFWEKENDSEWLFSYRLNSENLTYNANIYLPETIREELPATIFDEKQLRDVIKFVSSELTK